MTDSPIGPPSHQVWVPLTEVISLKEATRGASKRHSHP